MSGTGKRENTGAPESGLASVGEKEGRDPGTIAIHSIFGQQMADPLAGAEEYAKLGLDRVMVPAFFFAGPDGMDRLAAFGEQIVKPHAS